MLEGTRLRGVGGLCRIRFTLAPNQSQPGGNRASIAKQCGGVATHGTFQPRQGRAAANVIRFGISFAARSIVGKMVGNGVRKP